MQPSLAAEQEYENQACDNGRHGKRQVYQGEQYLLSTVLEARDGPGGGHPKNQIQGKRNCGNQQGQPDGCLRIGLNDRCLKYPPSSAESFNEHHGKGEGEEQAQKPQRNGDEKTSEPARFVQVVGTCVDAHAVLLPLWLRQACSPLMTRSNKNEIASITVAMAAAPA